MLCLSTYSKSQLQPPSFQRDHLSTLILRAAALIRSLQRPDIYGRCDPCAPGYVCVYTYVCACVMCVCMPACCGLEPLSRGSSTMTQQMSVCPARLVNTTTPGTHHRARHATFAELVNIAIPALLHARNALAATISMTLPRQPVNTPVFQTARGLRSGARMRSPPLTALSSLRHVIRCESGEYSADGASACSPCNYPTTSFNASSVCDQVTISPASVQPSVLRSFVCAA